MVLGNGPFLSIQNNMFDVGSLGVTQPSLAKREEKRKKNCGGY